MYTPSEDKAALDRLAADMDRLKPGAAGEFPPVVLSNPGYETDAAGRAIETDYARRLKAMTDTINPGYTVVEDRYEGWWRLLGNGLDSKGLGPYGTAKEANAARQAATLAYLAGWTAGVEAVREAMR